MKRILVTGARGMLGRDLMSILRSTFSKDEIIGWDIEEIDIRREDDTVNAVGALKPAVVIHLAAYTDVDGCESNEEGAFAVNAEGTRHVALAASACRAKMIYLSTDYVFDGEKGKPYLETDPPRPLNVYGRSKLKGEQYVQEGAGDFLIIRTQWLYGPFGKNFVDSILRQAREKETLFIVDDQTGSPTYTADLAKAICELILADARGIFHVANSEICTWYTFGQAILKLSGIDRVKVLPMSSKELGRPAARPSYSVLDCQKLGKETGSTMRPWFDALKDYLFTHRRPSSGPGGQLG